VRTMDIAVYKYAPYPTTGTKLDIAATDHIRPIAITIAMVMVIPRMSSSTSGLNRRLMESRLSKGGRRYCDGDHRKAPKRSEV
jgi:hypothetical protein